MSTPDSLRALLDLVTSETPRLPPASRYHGVGVAIHRGADGRDIPHLRRRFAPAPERLALLAEHRVGVGERLDRLAASYLGDPELFWRICDANAALDPHELTAVPGCSIRITLPDGVPGGLDG